MLNTNAPDRSAAPVRMLILLAGLLAAGGLAAAEKDPVTGEPPPPGRVSCDMAVVHDWNFNDGDHGFTTTACDDDGAQVWVYGDLPNFPEFGAAWATNVGSNYPNDAGWGLLSPVFTVDASTMYMEMQHVYGIEPDYDGGNVKANGEVILPMDGYPVDEISAVDNYYAWCVDGQPGFSGFTGHADWVVSCFDLSAFLGQEVQLRFDFGSDATVNYPGWAMNYVRIGGNTVATDEVSWTELKRRYR